MKTEIVEKRVVDAECSADRRLAGAEWVVGNPHSRTEQLRCIVYGKGRFPHRGRVLQYTVCIGKELGSAPVLLIPAIGKFMPKTEPEGKIGPQLYGVLRVPGAFPLPPVHDSGLRSAGEQGGLSLQKCSQAGKGSLPQLVVPGIRIHLHPLGPASEAELMLPTDDLHVILHGEEIPDVENVLLKT